MQPTPHDSITSTERSRLRMRPASAPPAAVDGGWWPRTRDLAEQLPGVLAELWDRLGGVERVIYDPGSWAYAAPRVAVRGRLVQLIADPDPDRHPGTILLVSAATGRAATLLVVPVEASRMEAEHALDTAATGGGTGIASRFIESATANPRTVPSGRSGRDVGGSFRARAAEERHAALERASAARTVAGHSTDAADCRMLLSVLGLDAGDGLRPT